MSNGPAGATSEPNWADLDLDTARANAQRALSGERQQSVLIIEADDSNFTLSQVPDSEWALLQFHPGPHSSIVRVGMAELVSLRETSPYTVQVKAEAESESVYHAILLPPLTGQPVRVVLTDKTQVKTIGMHSGWHAWAGKLNKRDDPPTAESLIDDQWVSVT